MNNYTEFYVSVDIEALGPIPGPYSMSSIGAFAAGARTKEGGYVQFDHTDKSNVFYGELKPISEKFTPDAINVGILEGFDTSIPDLTGERHFQWMKDHGENPKVVMQNFANFVHTLKESIGGAPIFMAYPASFDWTFVYWYLRNFEVESPFGFSGVLDIKSAFSIKGNKPLKHSTKRNMPKSLFSKLPHTHRADDDAIEQGILGMNILQWAGKAKAN